MEEDIRSANLYKIFTDDVRVKGTASSLSVIKLIEDELKSRERLQMELQKSKTKESDEKPLQQKKKTMKLKGQTEV